MALRIEKSFVVQAPRAAVWAFLIDPARVAACLPGASISGRIDDATWGGTMTMKVGPVTASYKGKLKFERLDEAAGEAELSGSGQETKGKGGAEMRMTSRLVERAPGVTEVTVTSDVNVFGLLAQMGRGMIEDVADQMFAKFSERMASSLTSGNPRTPAGAAATQTPEAEDSTGASNPSTATARPEREEVLDVGALGAGAAKRAAGRLIANPAFWAALVFLEGLVLLWCCCCRER